MVKSQKIIFIGLPGSGKSTLGRKISNLLGAPFIDLDEFIVDQVGQSIPEVFQELGEGGFRELESKFLKELLNLEGQIVISTGGGTPCFNDNIEIINTKGYSVFLDVPLSEITKRLDAEETSKRPLFANLEEGEMILKLKSLYIDRLPYYQQAKLIISGEDLSPEHFLAKWIHEV
jgi:shikimate kinase